MAKPNVHSASRDELVEAGVRAELVDEILKRRRKGAIRLEALEEVSGVGPATLEQLRQALDFREPQAAPSGNGNGSSGRASEQQQQRPQADDRNRVREGGSSDERRPREEEATVRTAEAARLGVKVARDTTAAVAETTTEATAEAARGGLQMVRRSTAAADQATRRSAAGIGELGQGLTELVHEQTRHNAATLMALGEAINWQRLFRIQSEYMQVSLERTAGLAQRYLDASQAVLTAAAKVGAAGRRNRGGSEAA
ncbi:MAG: phasin family protein [Geminicoccaceae bacterium]